MATTVSLESSLARGSNAHKLMGALTLSHNQELSHPTPSAIRRRTRAAPDGLTPRVSSRRATATATCVTRGAPLLTTATTATRHRATTALSKIAHATFSCVLRRCLLVRIILGFFKFIVSRLQYDRNNNQFYRLKHIFYPTRLFH